VSALLIHRARQAARNTIRDNRRVANHPRTALNILALDTSSDICAVALVRASDGRVFAREAVAHNKHSDMLLPMVASLLAEAALPRNAINVLAVGVGPGSFTGIRMAVALGQGLAVGLAVPMLAIDSLMILAESARTKRCRGGA
jgi:tRNA threonylcarbamoyladenosine biosynthesis protein TsaB